MIKLSNIFQKPFSNERISIAVVGSTSSGKSYLLSDIIQSFESMGFIHKDLVRNGVLYKDMMNYVTDVSDNGKMRGTEVYACRDENHYGAILQKGDVKVELDFLNIPGETFNTSDGKIINYKDFSAELRKSSTKIFRVAQWETLTGQIIKVVEPLSLKLEEDSTETTEHENSTENPLGLDLNIPDFNNPQPSSTSLSGMSEKERIEYRKTSYFSWKDLYEDFKRWGYKKKEGSTKLIDGKTLIDNFFTYQADSVMWSLAEIIGGIAKLETTKEKFIANYMRSFYFLHYCATATDIIVCDKLFVPVQGRTEDIPYEQALFAKMLDNLTNFINNKVGPKPNVYLAFRGADFMLQKKEFMYKKMVALLEENGFKQEEIRNIIYSIFAALIWPRLDARNKFNTASSNFNEMVGLGDLTLGEYTLERLQELFIDFNAGNGRTIEGSPDTAAADMVQLIRSHVGSGQGNCFRKLLLAAYDFSENDSSREFANMPPHCYFTATPITENFDVYLNDEDSENKRFIYKKEGQTDKYFDRANSHFCFGTFQLWLDILEQHGIEDLIKNNGEFLTYVRSHA